VVARQRSLTVHDGNRDLMEPTDEDAALPAALSEPMNALPFLVASLVVSLLAGGAVFVLTLAAR